MHKGMCAFINSNRTQPAFIKSDLTREKFLPIFVIRTFKELVSDFFKCQTTNLTKIIVLVSH